MKSVIKIISLKYKTESVALKYLIIILIDIYIHV